MRFRDIIGLDHIKQHLTSSADAGRIPHAQMFVGPEGCGTLVTALAYAQYVLCGNQAGENDGGNAACNVKCNGFAHPDLHFAFPVATSEKVKSHPVSDHYLEEWRQFLNQQPYGNLFDWYALIGIERKQGQIGVDEAQDIGKKLMLKSYEGGYKVLIIWMAERMNTAASNKLLKLIEEPPDKTVLLLVVEDEAKMMQTIYSRCQVLHFPPLAEAAIAKALTEQGLSQEEAQQVARESNGNFNRALDLMNKDSEILIFEKWFVQWVRSAFKARKNKGAIHDLILWSEELAKTGRETQKKFLMYGLNLIRQAMLLHYGARELAYMQLHVDGFKLENFAPFVHERNVEALIEVFEEAHYHIERNGNSKIIWTDLSVQLTRLLHKQATPVASK